MPKSDEKIHFELDTVFFGVTIGSETWSLTTPFFDLSVSAVFGIILVWAAVVIGGSTAFVWFWSK